MNGWNQHEKKWGHYYTPIPQAERGVGYEISSTAEEDKGFSVDAKTGLLLPEAAAKARRRVKTGFQPRDSECSP